MSEKFLLNLLYILAALAFWLLPVLLRWLRRRKEAEAVEPPPDPEPRHVEPPVIRSPFDALGAHLEDLEDLAAQVDELSKQTLELKSACAGPGLAHFNQLVDETLTDPLNALRRAVQAGIKDPASADALRLVSESSGSLMQRRFAAAYLGRIVREHGVEGHAQRNARGRALARIFLTRIESLLHKGSSPPSSPLFVPEEQPSLLHPELMSTLAATRAVPFDARAGRSPSPRAWAVIARDVALWAYWRMPGLEPEIEERYSSTLEGLGYRASLPPEGLVREVFGHALPALFLGPVYARAIEPGAEGPGGGAIARRMLELADADAAREGDLPLPVEIVLHVLDREPLRALAGSRLSDITGLRAEGSDSPRTAAAAQALLVGRVPAEMEFHVVTGAMLAALDHPRAAPEVAAAADRALGLAGAVDAWKDGAPVPGPRRVAPAGFISARAVREAVIVGALFER